MIRIQNNDKQCRLEQSKPADPTSITMVLVLRNLEKKNQACQLQVDQHKNFSSTMTEQKRCQECVS